MVEFIDNLAGTSSLLLISAFLWAQLIAGGVTEEEANQYNIKFTKLLLLTMLLCFLSALAHIWT